MPSNEATEKIEQLVFDENKVVTYKLLSSELNVHVNKAKQLLNEYITDHCTKGKNDLNVYYAVSGFQKYNGHKIHKLAVVSKDELEEVKKRFSALSSIHIYSIQKCSSLDECSLYTSDYLLARSSDDPNVFSAIRHPNLKIKAHRVIKNVEPKSDNKKTTATESQAVRKTEQKLSIPAKKTNALFTTWQKKEEQKNKTVKEQNGLPPTVLKNDDNTVPEKHSRSPPKASKTADKGNKNNIMNLFSKQAVKSTSRANAQNSEKSVSQNSVSSEAEKEEKHGKTEEKEEMRKEEERVKHVEVKSKKKETSQKKRQKQKRSHDISEDDSDDDWKKPKKKRKRIVAAFSDSDSESEGEEKKDRAQRNLMDSASPVKVESNGIEEDDEEIIPPTPDEEEPIPSKLLTSATNGKRKKLKIVNKTFEDEDGFLVTRKVKEYVTDSENSENEATSDAKVAPKAVPKPDIKKNFVNKKQSSLMSFFKQK